MRIRKPLSTNRSRLTILVLALVLAASLSTAHAQTNAGPMKPARPSSDDASQEITLTGNVSRVLPQGAPGMIAGSHLLLETSAGTVDASLGRFGLRGNGALPVAAGQQIEATGVIKTVHDKSIFLVRTVKIGDELYTIRNRHGLPVSPQARERTSQKGGSL
jgi:hypothetical protein